MNYSQIMSPPPSPFASKSGGRDPPSSYGSAAPEQPCSFAIWPTKRVIFALLLLLILLELIVIFEVTEPFDKWTFGQLGGHLFRL